MNKLTLPLLGALSAIDVAQDNPLEQKLDQLRSAVDTTFFPVLNQSSYVDKGRLKLSIDRCLNDVATLCNVPQLLGRTCIGFVTGDSAGTDLFSRLGVLKDSLYLKDIGVPYLLFHTNEKSHIQILLQTGKIANMGGLENHPEDDQYSLTPVEYNTLLELEAYGINIRSVVPAFLYFTTLKRHNSSYLILPHNEFAQEGSGRLIAQCNAIIVYDTQLDSDALQILRDNFTMPVYFVTSNEDSVRESINFLKSKYAGRVIETIDIAKLDNLLDSLSGYVERITLHDRLLAEMLNVDEFLSLDIVQHKELEKSLKKDSVLFVNKGSNLEGIIEKFQKDQKHSIRILNNKIDKFSEARQEILAIAKELEDMLHSEVAPNTGIPTCIHAGVMRPEALWRRIILRSLVSGKLEVAEKYQALYAMVYPEQSFLTEIYILKNKKIKLSGEQISKLRYMPDSPEVLRAKIYFREELNLSEQDCANIAALLPRPKDKDEKYYWACHLYEIYQNDKKLSVADPLPFSKVVEAFREAVLAGSKNAARTLAAYCGGERLYDEAKKIADISEKNAAYIYYLLCSTKGEHKLGLRYKKIAASLGHSKALDALAKEYWNSLENSTEVSFDAATGIFNNNNTKLINAGIMIYDYLCKNTSSKDNNIRERLGVFYFHNKQWTKSRDVLREYHETALGKFAMSIMLKYGLGGNTNKSDAIKLMREVECVNSLYAKFAYKIKNFWFAQEMKKL